MAHDTKMDKKRMVKHRSRSSFSKRACTLYTFPSSTSTIQAFTPATLTWDTSCYAESAGEDAPANVDMYLYDAVKPIMQWRDVPFAAGKLDTQFDSAWWGNSTTGRVHLQMLTAGDPLWSTVVPSGPIFLVAYNGTYPTTTSSSSDSSASGLPFSSISLASSSGGLSGGKLAAAVAVPIIFVACAIFGYVAWSRFKTRKASRRYSAAVDARMSAMGVPGWQPGMGSARPSMSSHRTMGSRDVRHSAAFSARHSAYLASLPQAHLAGGMPDQPEMSQRSVSPMSSNPNRASRISFAASTADAVQTSHRGSKRYSLAGGAGAMGAGSSRLGPMVGHTRGAGSNASALSAYSAYPRPSMSPTVSSRTIPQMPSQSGLRHAASFQEQEEDDDLAMSPEQTASPMMLATSDVDSFRSGPAPPTPVKRELVGSRGGRSVGQDGQTKTDSVVSVGMALQNQLMEMGPAIDAIVSGRAGDDDDEREVVGQDGWDDDDDDEDGAQQPRKAPLPPTSPVAPSSPPKKKGFFGGFFGGGSPREEQDEAKTVAGKGKVVIGHPIIMPGSQLEDVRRTGVVRTRGGDFPMPPGVEGILYGQGQGQASPARQSNYGTWKGGYAE